MHQHTVHKLKLVLGEMQCKCFHAGCLSGPPAPTVCSSGGVVVEVVVEEVVVEGTLVEVEINSPCNLWDQKMGYISNKT